MQIHVSVFVHKKASQALVTITVKRFSTVELRTSMLQINLYFFVSNKISKMYQY